MPTWMRTRELIEDHLKSLGCSLDAQLIAEYLLQGISITDIAKKHNLSTPTIRLYIRRSLMPIAHELNVISPLLGNCSACSKTFHYYHEDEDEADA